MSENVIELFGKFGFVPIPVGDIDNHYFANVETGEIYRVGKANNKLKAMSPDKISNQRGDFKIRIGKTKYKHYKTHQLIILAALGKMYKGWHIHHINHDKTDNRLVNLLPCSIADHWRLHKLLKTNLDDYYSEVSRMKKELGLPQYVGTKDE